MTRPVPPPDDARVREIALKPCPFCGGSAETDSAQAYRNIVNGRIETAVAVYCLSCAAQISICHGDVPDAHIDEVVEAWNKRAIAALYAPEVERMREALHLALNTMRSFSIFIHTKEKAHPDGVELYSETIRTVAAALSDNPKPEGET